MLASIMPISIIPAPQLATQSCLNAETEERNNEVCTKCRDVCPAQAIHLLPANHSSANLPELDTAACTGCTACVSICPADAMRHAAVRPVELVRHAMTLVHEQGKTTIQAACSAADNNHADLTLPCHATWNPMLLASLAAEGIRSLHLDGLTQCTDCPMQHGAKIMQQTEKDYATLNQALGVRLKISHTMIQPDTTVNAAGEPEPQRRAFFRNLLPSITQTAAMASAQISQAAQQLSGEHVTSDRPLKPSLLPVRLRLFLRALPKLQSTFTPVPPMPSLPLGAIQADERCTACGDCVEQCPTKALYLKEFGENMVLEFRPDACIGCSRCINICPEEALESLLSISLPALLTGKARPLVMVSGSKITGAKKHPT